MKYTISLMTFIFILGAPLYAIDEQGCKSYVAGGVYGGSTSRKITSQYSLKEVSINDPHETMRRVKLTYRFLL